METQELRGRSLLRVGDWSAEEIGTVLDLADELKTLQHARAEHRLLPGRTLGMIFEKPSTRTRVSFEAGMSHLGGTALHLGLGELHLGKTESIRDTAVVLSRYLDAILIRTFHQADVDELAAHATVPVVNGLTDDYHPCQALADVMTIRERFGRVAGIRVAYVGDGNNVCHSLMAACAALGADMVVATPPAYAPGAEPVARARAAAAASGGSLELGNDPVAAVNGADVVYTDVWTSMGQEAEQEERLRAFEGFTVDDALLEHAAGRAIVMHCLPAHWGEEITEDVLHGPRSAAWDQAENRLHAQKALLALVVR